MPRSQPITVEPEEEQRSFERHPASGAYDTASEVPRAGLRALDREREAFEDTMRERGNARPAAEVLERLRRRHFQRWGKMPDEV